MKRVRDMQMDMGDIYTYDVWDGDDCIVKNPSPYSSLEQAKEAAREYLLENFVPTDRSKDDGFQMALVYNGNETISSGSFDNSYVIASWNKHNNSIAEFNFPKWLRKFAKNPNENLSKWYYDVDKYTDVMDSRKIKDSNIAYSVLDENDRLLDEFTSKEKAIAYAEKNNKADGVVRFKYSEDGDVLDAKEIWTKNKSVSDSRKIKDADETQDVLDGILMIAFNDGSEEEGYNEVKKHANEQGELDGVQYETYDTDNQDGVTLIDLCAATDDANAFVKALLTEWGIIDAVADIEFEKSELMENAEVSDSRKISDRKHYEGDNNNYTEYKNCDYVIEGGARFSTEGEDFQQKTSEATIWVNSNVGKTDFWGNIVIPNLKKKFKKFGYIGYYTWDESSDNVIGVKLVSDNGITDDDVMNVIDEFMLICNQVSDSKVEDMTKPAHLRGYAEKYRKKRREQKESYKENEEETQNKEVSDSRRIKDYVVGTKHPQEYFAELRWMLESLKKRGYIDAYLDDDIIKGFAEYYDYPSLREFNEWGDEEVAAGFDEYLESLDKEVTDSRKIKDEENQRFVPVKRDALDGKVWWVVYDNKYHKYSTATCFGKYKTAQDCQWAIDYYTEQYGSLL